MKPRHIVLTDAAVNDILEQAAWYQEQSGLKLARRWEQAVTSVLLRIVATPASGAPCTFKAADLKGVRRVPVPRFPKHLVFYRVRSQELIVLRIVHGARDLESLF
ncbi:MAG TPA: type II toxin-antitoxin system RelE/ParE family toxin [Candidatus Angelobacter sp.]|nr:type II toxin-antitoxin system RelE/ParE family toxin [Candidatus Angelobacter sp.]